MTPEQLNQILFESEDLKLTWDRDSGNVHFETFNNTVHDGAPGRAGDLMRLARAFMSHVIETQQLLNILKKAGKNDQRRNDSRR